MLSVLFFVFLVWTATTVLSHLSPTYFNKIKKLDVFCLIPAWNFFSPIPAKQDCYLMAEEEGKTGSGWIVVCGPRQKKWYSFILNPVKLGNKILFDVSNDLIENRKNTASEPYVITMSHGYLSCMAKIEGCREIMSGDNEYRFSLIAKSNILTDPSMRIVFVSRTHTK